MERRGRERNSRHCIVGYKRGREREGGDTEWRGGKGEELKTYVGIVGYERGREREGGYREWREEARSLSWLIQVDLIPRSISFCCCSTQTLVCILHFSCFDGLPKTASS